ncbi:MAG: hypothetical protein Q8R48_07195 [Candidatus Omnitrophota bacterium]|nr:hypothetical protein [Candidatus Omnitrophota bacterium]
MKIKKSVSTTIKTKKEAIKMIKKCLAVTLAALIIIFNVVPAQAITYLPTQVAISATGILTGSTAAFTATLCTQATGTDIPSKVVPFGTVTNPTTLSDSGTALKFTAATNEVTGRVIIYTDNSSLLGDNPSATPPTFGNPNPNTGADGAGMVGTTVTGYQVPLIWGVKSLANGDPNTNMDYTFPTPADFLLGKGAVYIVDKRHTHSYTGTSNTPYASNPAPYNTAAGMDVNPMYSLTGTTNLNPSTADGLYPQAFAEDYYNLPAGSTGRVVVSQALYKNIATVVFGIGPGVDPAFPTDATKNIYVGNVPQVSDGTGSVTVKLAKIGTAAVDNYVYVYIGADFRTSPAQDYSTTKLYVGIIRD